MSKNIIKKERPIYGIVWTAISQAVTASINAPNNTVDTSKRSEELCNQASQQIETIIKRAYKKGWIDGSGKEPFSIRTLL